MEQVNFGRIKTFVDELEKAELIENEEALILLGAGTDVNPRGSNNCQCSGNNCQCNGANNCQC